MSTGAIDKGADGGTGSSGPLSGMRLTELLGEVLRNLAARAERRGGACSVKRLPEGGTRVRWSAPLR